MAETLLLYQDDMVRDIEANLLEKHYRFAGYHQTVQGGI